MKLLDFHVHMDYYNNPQKIIEKYENMGIYALFMTNLPEMFENNYFPLLGKKNVRLALGFHPELVSEFEFDFFKFQALSKFTSYIGEIGLDFSKENIIYKEKQLKIFEQIIEFCSHNNKVFSIHSRKAEKEVLEILKKYKIKNAIFHWYSGPVKLINEILENGYYFSLNYKMLSSIQGRKILKAIPLNNILIETDGPFVRYEKKIVSPEVISNIYKDFASFYDNDQIEKIIYKNFKKIIKDLKSN